MTVIPVLERLREENHKFETSLGYKGDPVSKLNNNPKRSQEMRVEKWQRQTRGNPKVSY